MLFNSLDFALFLPLVFLIYWFGFQRNIRAQNAWLVIASYVFYGWWDYRFLSLILFSTVVDYSIGWFLGKDLPSRTRKVLLWLSLGVNLGLLGFFKYYHFFLDNFIAAFRLFGQEFEASSLSIILPVGISFYTFQTLSYSIDLYRRKIQPTRDFLAFAAYVSFFPQLVAGPIERAGQLLPQFFFKRVFNYSLAVQGMRQILWGLFKKVVVADNAALIANAIFNNSDDYGGSTLLLGAIFFAFQIYGDFSGYSDIAIGTARLFGFRLMQNFAFPYFSRDIAEFWRRWHISLSTWFRDYVYIPLGGSKGGVSMKLRNTFAIFLISGFWHGANWTFIIWGALNALYFLPLLLTKNNRKNLEIVAYQSRFPKGREFLSMIGTFLLTTLAWVFFRAENVSHAWSYLEGIFSITLFQAIPTARFDNFYLSLFFIFLLLLIEWFGRRGSFALEKLDFVAYRWLRWTIYLLLAWIIFLFAGKEEAFIYFQF